MWFADMSLDSSEENFKCTQEVEIEGHLIDSMILTRVLDIIMDHEGDFEILEFRMGKRRTDFSHARVLVKGKTQSHLDYMLRELLREGAAIPKAHEVKLVPAPRDMVLPDDFYSTTNHSTSVFLRGKWVDVEGLVMDKQIVVDPDKLHAYCKPIRLVKKGDLIVVGEAGIRVRPPARPREGVAIFEFMTSSVSSEKPSASIVKRIARELDKARKSGKKIAVVAGPAVVHTGASPHLAEMIRLGYVGALLSGNALAVHDVEYSLYGTSLGMNLETGYLTKGERNHMAAINEVSKAGSLKALVVKGVLKKGIFYECIINGVPFSLAGSIRDDGPIPDVITDSVEAQREYARLVNDADVVLMLASMLHSIAVGNMLPSTVKVVFVDINPAVMTKLSDRGTAHAVGIITDVGTFLPLLVEELRHLRERDESPKSS
jgi:lysine-ketoglutarate reductase/saccharopine dehydrogenase-like protein (TIGR00300 family)